MARRVLGAPFGGVIFDVERKSREPLADQLGAVRVGVARRIDGRNANQLGGEDRHLVGGLVDRGEDAIGDAGGRQHRGAFNRILGAIRNRRNQIIRNQERGTVYPSRLVCLTEETTETLYLLDEGDRIVGISGYTVRPPEARKKPKVSSFLHARYEKIEALQPDLILAFSDLQAEITNELVRRGLPVFTFNQRSVAEILQMIRVLGGIVGVSGKAEALARRLADGLDRIRAPRPGSRAGRASISRNGTTRSSAGSSGSRS